MIRVTIEGDDDGEVSRVTNRIEAIFGHLLLMRVERNNPHDPTVSAEEFTGAVQVKPAPFRETLDVTTNGRA